MKSKRSKDAAVPAKGKVKIKNLKITKETVENLSDSDAAIIKGGATWSCAGGDGGASKMQCWVARAVYGEDNPRWMLFRVWLMANAPAWFRGLYLRHG